MSNEMPAMRIMTKAVLIVVFSSFGCTVALFNPADQEGPPANFSGEWVDGVGAMLRIEQNGESVTVTGAQIQPWRGSIKGRVMVSENRFVAMTLAPNGNEAMMVWSVPGGISGSGGVRRTSGPWSVGGGATATPGGSVVVRAADGKEIKIAPNAGASLSDTRCVLCNGAGVWTGVLCPGCDGTGIWGQRKNENTTSTEVGSRPADRVPPPLERKNASGYFTQGLNEYSSGAFDNAVTSFSRAIELSSDFPEAILYRGYARRAKGDLDGALADLSKASEGNPQIARRPEFYFNRGLIWQAKGDLDKAIVEFSKSIELDPDQTANLFHYRGSAKFSKKDYAGAIADYSRAIDLGWGDTAGIYYWRAIAKERTGDNAGALEDMTQSTSMKPDPKAFLERGMLRRMTGDFDGALKDFSKAIEFNPQYVLAYQNRGYTKGLKGNTTEALADLVKAIEIDPKLAQNYRVRGYVRYNSQLWSDALSDFKKSLEVGPSAGSDRAHLYLWLLLTRLDQKETATKELEEFLKQKRQGKPDDWSLAMGRFLAGELSEEDLTKLAAIPDKNLSEERRCQAYFYSASKRLLGGDRAGAIEVLKKCLETSAKSIPEHYSAVSELRTLEGGK